MTRRELVQAVAGFLAAVSGPGLAVSAGAEPVLRRVAAIPMPIFWELERLGISKDPRRMEEWLNLPENAVFLLTGRE